MATEPCQSCGSPIDPTLPCPHCGADSSQLAAQLAAVERELAEMSAQDVQLLRDRTLLSRKMQAALHRRAILANAQDERVRRASAKTKRPPTRARRPIRVPTKGTRPHTVPRQTREPFAESTGEEPPPGTPPPAVPPEASSRSVQNILLALGGFLLGVAAIVFAGLAISTLDAISRGTILIVATAVTLIAAIPVAKRGLTATAETIAAVGLLLVPVDGYTLWTVDQLGADVIPGPVFAGAVSAATAAVAAWYAGRSGLTVPRYVTVLALQPILPLLAYDLITSLTGWALVLTAVAAADLVLAVQLSTRLAAWSGATRVRPEAEQPTPSRPEAAPEEPDAVITVEGEVIPPERPAEEPPEFEPAEDVEPARPARPAQPPSVAWLHGLTWILHGIAFGAALAYAVGGLVAADTVAPALRAGVALLLAAAVGLAGSLVIRRRPLPDVAGGLMTLAIIVAATRVAAVALPGRAMLLISVVIAVTSLGVRLLPAAARRGPQLASAIALAVIGVVVAGNALRAALAPIRAALPVWDADLSTYMQKLAEAVAPAGGQIVASALLLTIAAALALPQEIRRECAVAGATLTALCAPASLGLDWYVGPWIVLLAAAVIGATGLTADTERGARAHTIGGAVAGLAAAAASVANPALTAGILTGLSLAAILVAAAARVAFDRPGAAEVEEWATGGAAFAVPGAVSTVAAAMAPVAGTETALEAVTAPVLAAGFLAACVSLAYAALTLVADRHISLPLSIGASLGALAVTAAAFGAPGATLTDAWIGALLMVAGILLFLAPSIDAGRRADRLLDGPDFAAAAVTAATVASLARVVWLLAPNSGLVAAALLVLAVAVVVRLLPEQWRRGPTFGVALAGAVVAAIAGATALRDGLRVLAAPGPLWNGDLSAWPSGADPDGWQVPVALGLLAVAAAVVLPKPGRYDAEAILVGLAALGTPVAFGMPWWSPVLIGGAVAAAYGTAAAVTSEPRAARARAVLAAVMALHATGAGLVRPWTTAAALLLIALLGAVVATLALVNARLLTPPSAPDDALPTAPAEPILPPHLAQIGGAALGGSLLAWPGAVAALAAGAGRTASVVLAGALAAASIGLALVAVARRQIPQYLPYATVGIAGGATAVAIAALPTDEPGGVYAAAAALLGVVAELIRQHTRNPASGERVQRWSVEVGGPTPRRRAIVVRAPSRWAVSPPMGALAAAALPAALAVASLAPALVAALVNPIQTLDHRWQGPPAALLNPVEGVDETSVLTALLLTIATALAAVGFSTGRTYQAIPVMLPGLAITLLITPIALQWDWPASTMAALIVFTACMLGLALVAPPPRTDRARPLHITRLAVFVIGLAAGGAGLAGSLATQSMTLFTLGGAVGVGLTAGLFGRTQNSRILGWLFASVMAQMFVLTAGLIAGFPREWSAFGVLGVGAALLVVSATLPRLRRPEATREAAAVEWSGYAAALLALALAYRSLPHVAGLLAAWGAVLGIAATRPGRRTAERRILFWAAVGFEICAWWLMMTIAEVALPEAYTLPFAALALLVGVLERQHRPDLDSWMAYGPALLAAFVPTLIIVFTREDSGAREVLLLLGAVATLIAGSIRRQRAPVVVGAVVTAVTAVHALTRIGPWLVLIPVGLVLLVVGATYEKRRRDLQRLRGAFNRMR